MSISPKSNSLPDLLDALENHLVDHPTPENIHMQRKYLSDIRENHTEQPDEFADIELESLIWRILIPCVRSNLGMKETAKRIAEAIGAMPKRKLNEKNNAGIAQGEHRADNSAEGGLAASGSIPLPCTNQCWMPINTAPIGKYLLVCGGTYKLSHSSYPYPLDFTCSSIFIDGLWLGGPFAKLSPKYWTDMPMPLNLNGVDECGK